MLFAAEMLYGPRNSNSGVAVASASCGPFAPSTSQAGVNPEHIPSTLMQVSSSPSIALAIYFVCSSPRGVCPLPSFAHHICLVSYAGHPAAAPKLKIRQLSTKPNEVLPRLPALPSQSDPAGGISGLLPPFRRAAGLDHAPSSRLCSCSRTAAWALPSNHHRVCTLQVFESLWPSALQQAQAMLGENTKKTSSFDLVFPYQGCPS